MLDRNRPFSPPPGYFRCFVNAHDQTGWEYDPTTTTDDLYNDTDYTGGTSWSDGLGVWPPPPTTTDDLLQPQISQCSWWTPQICSYYLLYCSSYGDVIAPCSSWSGIPLKWLFVLGPVISSWLQIAIGNPASKSKLNWIYTSWTVPTVPSSKGYHHL